MRKVAATAAVAVGLTVVGVAAWSLLGNGGAEPGIDAGLSLAETLGGATDGYALAELPRPFDFPADHGPHPDFRTEWWYFTGNLEAPEGRRFGYQVTFFRSALAPPDRAADAGEGAPLSGDAAPTVEDGETPRRSAWRTRQAWMAHFAVTDVGAGRFHAFERFERGAVGLAGATVDPGLRVWTGDWEVVGRADAGPGPEGVFPLTLRLSTDSVAVDLVLEPVRGIVLQGDSGLSRKGPGLGDASYYYTFPRLRTGGTVTTPDGRFEVTGTSWLDREWSTSVLPDGVVGWDWFALQLAGDRELMVYRLRRADGSAAPWSEGVLVEGTPGGGERVTHLGPDDFTLEPVASWSSPRDGSAYPVRWRVRVPRASLDLEVAAVLPAQELNLAFRYWEGAVDARPWGTDGPAVGRGYLEMTGYAGSGPPAR